MKLPKKIHAVDLFCGAGGTSTGLARACKAMGTDVDLVAVNHWETAVNTHAANHPWARHYCVPVEAVNPREAFPGGVVHILCASPECTHHSTARGGKPVNDQLRSSAWHIMRWVNELDVRCVLIENVPEFEAWGPVSQKTGRPIKRQRGRYFKAFVDALSACGYAVQWRVLNAADYGDATSRRRLFVLARKGRRAPAWPKPSHSKAGKNPGTLPWRSAREIIDWSIQGQSIFNRDRPLAQKTVERILKGLERHGGPELQPFLVLLRGTGAGRSLQEPVPALTAGGEHVGLAQPFLLGQQSGGAPRSVEDPVPTVAAGGAISVVEPFLIPPDGPGGNGRHNGPRSVDDPMPTIRATRGGGHLVQPVIVPSGGPERSATPANDPLGTILGREHYALADPVLVPYYGNSGAQSVGDPLPAATTRDRFGVAEPCLVDCFGTDVWQSRARSIEEPVPAITAGGDRLAVAEPFIVPHFGERDGQAPRTHALGDPLPTVTSQGAGSLVEPCLVHVTHGGRDHSLNQPLPTVTGANRGELALVQPVINGRMLDIRFRMLQPHELARAMGFGDDYEFVGNRRDVVKQIGNAVAVNMSRALIESLLMGESAPQVRLPEAGLEASWVEQSVEVPA